ncbi:hypothetical protein BGW38_006905 [Lunasporangiospora selenospora]|uniref:Ribosome-assembly protein 3 C-terminal domain-containing protein n=1 Tax=Lunasporangiospora selenospora TaxID=979761 RepID=A0A9P6FYU9_9FUNG|nr:hypothetical protein BGW38_006905 [Lunasporangiospora selenospora]
MGSKSASKRTSSKDSKEQVPAAKRAKRTSQENQSSIDSSDTTANDNVEKPKPAKESQKDEEDASDVDMEMMEDRESSDDGSDIEDEEDQELKAHSASTPQSQAHTSDRVQKVLSNPEIESAFHDQYMTKITQAFGDELNTLRETDSLDGPHLELLIDSLNQTGHIYRVLEKELWVAEALEEK